MTCIAVMGFYRTGSSAVAGILHELGVFMGDQFDPSNDKNPGGYWEDVAFKSLHQSLLERENVKKEYLALIREREKLPIWGVKDPFLCLLLPRLIDNLKTDYKIIHCTRKDEDSIASLIRNWPDLLSDKTKFFKMRELYKNYERQFLIKYHKASRLHVVFEDIFSSNIVETIANFVGLSITVQAKHVVVPRN